MAPRIPPVNTDTLPAAAGTILQQIQGAIGMIPNLHRTLAHAPAALKAYVSMAGALGTGTLDPQLREQIALLVAARNGCSYCASAHTALGKGAGLGAEEMTHNLSGRSADPRTQIALAFAEALLETKGRVSDSKLKGMRSAGFEDPEILEIVAHVGMNTFTNMVNELARTDIDFPKVDLPAEAGAGSR